MPLLSDAILRNRSRRSSTREATPLRANRDHVASELPSISPIVQEGAVSGVLIARQEESLRVVGQRPLRKVPRQELAASARCHHAEARKRSANVGTLDR